ncbi:hypothetical protein [Streptosporangium roseum DSM] [Mycolicibacterium parafortuitum]|uniref:AB hydrolase-1 domain-containing protein n=2 Tax=Mycolicibacterium parafortuitum TaxID=39692 RepID=A0A375YLA8_MYCPF|nr:hypothetical protein [Streptosporangium roseum DSM] [Mycolicibacterium parafortuitum]
MVLAIPEKGLVVDARPMRLVLAAAMLSSWAVIGLSAGVAHADDDTSGSAASSGAASQTDRVQTDRVDRVPAKPSRPARSSADTAKPDGTETSGDSTDNRTAKTTRDRAGAAGETEEAEAVDNDAEAVDNVVEFRPRTPLRTAAIRDTADTENPADTADAADAAEAPPVRPTLGRQLVGGVSDVGTIVVSVVHAAATAVAEAVGPDAFYGVPHLLATIVANTAAAVGRTLVGGRLHEPDTDQHSVGYGLLDMRGLFDPTKPPPGANDPTTTVTDEHPLPVILLNSTVLTQGVNWYAGAPALAGAGYKVYTFNYGNVTSNPRFPLQSIADIRRSAAELDAEINRVLIETGAPQVILIGHSQGGGALPSYYINAMGGAAKVSQLIGIGPGHHGTDFMGLVGLVLKLPILRQLYIGISEAIAPAFYQQSVGSPFLDEVYGDGDTRPGVLYTNISTVYDEVATPYTNQALDGPNVTNIVLQDRHPGLLLGHLNMVTSPLTWAVVLEALAANPAANRVPLTVAA